MNVGNFELGKDGAYIIAELSANHGGDLQIALDSIKAAKEIGANAIKIQTFTADEHTLNCDKDDFIVRGGTLWDGRKLYDLYDEAHLPWEWHKTIFDYAKEIGITCFSAPVSKKSVDFLETFDVPIYKIASFEITDCELIRYIASKGKPIILSTGIATIEEIQDAVDICRSEGNDNIIVLKCTSAYPAALRDANLLTIPNLAQTFGVISGFSDHTLGATAPVVATTLGAQVVEKHFILDKSIGGADADFSLDKEEFKEMIQAVRDTEMLLGKVDYTMTEQKKKSRRFSRSLYVAKDIKKGEVFTEENIRSVRPGYGMHPKYFNDVLGEVAEKDYEFGDRFEK
jgi:pseudaminic acid synthase